MILVLYNILGQPVSVDTPASVEKAVYVQATQCKYGEVFFNKETNSFWAKQEEPYIITNTFVDVAQVEEINALTDEVLNTYNSVSEIEVALGTSREIILFAINSGQVLNGNIYRVVVV